MKGRKRKVDQLGTLGPLEHLLCDVSIIPMEASDKDQTKKVQDQYASWTKMQIERFSIWKELSSNDLQLTSFRKKFHIETLKEEFIIK